MAGAFISPLRQPAHCAPAALCCAALQLEKVLDIWRRRAVVSEALLKPALQQARAKRAQHSSAWGDEAAAPAAATAPSAAAADAAGQGQASERLAHGAGSGGRRPVPVTGPAADAQLWRWWRRMPISTGLLFKFLDNTVRAPEGRRGKKASLFCWAGRNKCEPGPLALHIARRVSQPASQPRKSTTWWPCVLPYASSTRVGPLAVGLGFHAWP